MTKQQLLESLKNPRGLLIAVDLDETLCEGPFWEGDCKPKEDMIERVWDWYKSGAHIIIYTARQPRYYSLTHAWLLKHEVPFHGICMQMKPGAAVYVDDRGLNIEDVL